MVEQQQTGGSSSSPPGAPGATNGLPNFYQRRISTMSSYRKLGLLKGFDEYMEQREMYHGLGFDNPAMKPANGSDEAQQESSEVYEMSNTSNPKPSQEYKPSSRYLYFNDSKRRIDMVLAFEDDDDEKRTEKREAFEKNIQEEGLEIEIQNKENSLDTKTSFVKIHAPWDVLTRYAELMNIKKPIKSLVPKNKLVSLSYNAWEKEDEFQTKKKWPFKNVRNPFEIDHNRIPQEPSFFMAAFNRNKESLFIIKDRESFFTPAQRSQIVWQILLRTKYGEEKLKMGVTRLLGNGTYKAAFPLHDGDYNKDDESGVPNDRRLLYSEWAHPAKCIKEQPLWLVRRYFGDKIGLYFCWLGFYTQMLIPASVVGVMCFLLGLISMESDYYTPVKEICNKTGTGNLTMCPLCDKVCNYWKLSDSCLFTQLTYPFDNPATVFFAVFMAFWATSFLELWKRRQSVVSWEWDLGSYDGEEEVRPEFEAAVKTSRINPITQVAEPYLPTWHKMVRIFAVSSMVLFMLFIVMGVVVGIIVYRLSMLSIFFATEDQVILKYAKLITSMSAACINLAMIVILQMVYFKLAKWLTNLEFPRTKREYEDSFTFKMFLFQFINYYSALIYIAFFKGRFFRHPGDKEARDNQFVKIRVDLCDVGGCLSELFIQLSIIMVGKQFMNNILELLVPKVQNYINKWKTRKALGDEKGKPMIPQWEQDYQLKEMGDLGLFSEYLEMVIQYGFVTLFVAAFPLAPFFALMNNIIEIRLDAYKMVTQLRRPLAERVEDIGAWYGILQGITYTAVVTNAFVIAYTSDFIPRMVYKYVYSANHDFAGYIEASLALFDTANYTIDMKPTLEEGEENPDVCRYRGYRNPPNSTNPYEYSDQYWHVFAARLSLVVVFEHLVFALTGIMAFAIPDVPQEIQTQIQREKLLAKEAMFESEVAKMRQERFHAASMGADNAQMSAEEERARALLASSSSRSFSLFHGSLRLRTALTGTGYLLGPGSAAGNRAALNLNQQNGLHQLPNQTPPSQPGGSQEQS